MNLKCKHFHSEGTFGKILVVVVTGKFPILSFRQRLGRRFSEGF